MTRKEAEQLAISFESGYIKKDNPDLIEAARLMRKKVRSKRIGGISNPQSAITIRTVTTF